MLCIGNLGEILGIRPENPALNFIVRYYHIEELDHDRKDFPEIVGMVKEILDSEYDGVTVEDELPEGSDTSDINPFDYYSLTTCESGLRAVLIKIEAVPYKLGSHNVEIESTWIHVPTTELSDEVIQKIDKLDNIMLYSIPNTEKE